LPPPGALIKYKFFQVTWQVKPVLMQPKSSLLFDFLKVDSPNIPVSGNGNDIFR
jgi:hypothetical protein